ncbi:MAG: hypothetical protein ACE5HV_17875 [Acidobacteriota bacterium]
MPATVATPQQVVLRQCAEIRRLDAGQYWFWDAYFGLAELQDAEGERFGRLSFDPQVCFRVQLEGLNDPSARTRGYRQAIVELMKWVAERADPEGKEVNSAAARLQLEKVTGRQFATHEAWTRWWNENKDFLWWSVESGHLEVDEVAKRAGAPLNDDFMLLKAEDYWFYSARGWIVRSRQVGDFIQGSVLIPPHGYTFRIREADLDDRQAKERGYRLALENLIFDGLKLPELQGTSPQWIIAQLGRISGEHFQDRDSWISWWEENKDRLQLSADGRRLTVRPRDANR